MAVGSAKEVLISILSIVVVIMVVVVVGTVLTVVLFYRRVIAVGRVRVTPGSTDANGSGICQGGAYERTTHSSSCNSSLRSHNTSC